MLLRTLSASLFLVASLHFITATPRSSGSSNLCPGSNYVYCRTNPCRSATCPLIPTARCRPNHCGECNARFFVHGIEVTQYCQLAELPELPGVPISSGSGISSTDEMPIQCDVEGQVYTECTCGCGRSCEWPSSVSCSCPCVPGCECPAGTLLDRVQNKCVSSQAECESMEREREED